MDVEDWRNGEAPISPLISPYPSPFRFSPPLSAFSLLIPLFSSPFRFPLSLSAFSVPFRFSLPLSAFPSPFRFSLPLSAFSLPFPRSPHLPGLDLREEERGGVKGCGTACTPRRITFVLLLWVVVPPHPV
ncbi:unnamed protein product [Closterium sp. Naga37s-1]|nr:unnamed protein product [Closterium sp. Naga37s-1]